MARIQCVCDWCRHEGAIEVPSLMAKIGGAATYRDVAERLVCSACGWHGIVARPVWPGGTDRRSPDQAIRPDRTIRDVPIKTRTPLPSMDECRAVLAAAPADPAVKPIDQRAAHIRALMERWPELNPSAATFVVQALEPRLPSQRDAPKPAQRPSQRPKS